MYYHNQMSGSPSSLSENVYLQNPNTLPLLDQIVASNPVSSTRWNSMKKTRQSTTGNSGYVADLIAYISKVIGVNYSIQHSTADIVSATLGYFGLSGQSSVSSGNLSSSFVSTILNNLRNDKPLITVRRTSLSSLPTHTWIIDGFVREQTTYYTTYRFYYVDDPSAISGQYNGYQIVNFYNDEEMASLLPGYTNGSEMVEQSSFETKYFLMNWGLDNGAYDSIRQNVDVWSINGTNYAANYREFYYNISAL